MEESREGTVAQEVVLCVRSSGSRCSNIVEKTDNLCLSCIERAQRSIFAHVRRWIDEKFLGSNAATHLCNLIAAVANVTTKKQLDFLVKRLRRHLVDLGLWMQQTIVGRAVSDTTFRFFVAQMEKLKQFEHRLHRIGRRFLGYKSEVPLVSPVG